MLWYSQVIVNSHSELRCPECRVLVDIKIDDLPPNVLLMRILEGMKNASHNQTNSNEPPLATLNGAKQIVKNAQQVTPSTRNTKVDHPYPLNENGVQPLAVLPVPPQPQMHVLQPQQIVKAMPAAVSNGASTAGTNVPTPHARAQYDFAPKEEG